MAKRILKNIRKNWDEYEVWNIKTYTITEDITTVTTEATVWVSPYDTSYGYTNITIDENSWIKWKEWAIYSFVVNTEMVVDSSKRNVRVRIGSSWSWIPVMDWAGVILNWNTFLQKNNTLLFIYKTTYQSTWALHLSSSSVLSVNWQTWAVSLTIPTISTITVTLTTAWWSSNSQTVTATGVTANNTVIVSPAPSDIADYADKWVYCSAQGSGTLTFGCDTAPSGDIVVNVLIMS